MKFIINVLILLCFFASAGYAQTFVNITADEGDSFYTVLVEKELKQTHLLKITGSNVEIVDSFPVLIGRIDGDKNIEGDEKTPEGLYFVTGFLSPAKLTSMYGNIARQYGTGAYPLSYPNLKDRLDRKTGGGIWLHGVDPERGENVTKGCVAFDNDKVDMLGDYISRGTPVVITSEGLRGDSPSEYFEALKSKIMEYAEAWETNDIDAFAGFYHKDFTGTGGQSTDAYVAFKKRLMDIYPYRKVDLKRFRMFYQSSDEAVAEFDQFYCAPNVISYGRKRLYLERGESGLQIAAEEFAAGSAEDYIRGHVNSFLIDWKKAWESRGIESYIGHYSENFSTRGMDRNAWKEDKSGKFADLSSVNVTIEDISFRQVTPNKFTIEFLQIYKGDEYSDRGRKTLNLEGCPGDFKIVSEYWRAE